MKAPQVEGRYAPAPIRFFRRVELTPTCWLWHGAVSIGGYGRFMLNGRAIYAHRVSYAWLGGELPSGHELDHVCGIRRCVRPDHLEPVTHRENLLRGDTFASRNAMRTHCHAGHEYTPENTRHSRWGRRCRACARERQRVRRASKRAAYVKRSQQLGE
jgi:hypothetical protein